MRGREISMKALVYVDWRVLEVKDVPVPEIGEDEALVRVEACGICGSELEAYQSRSPRRKPPLVLGHEYCGIIEALGDGVTDLHVGQNVVGNSVISCGKCYPCVRGDTNLCSERQVLGMHRQGAIAEFVAIPADYLYPRPHTLSPILATLTEPLANGVHIMNLLPDVKQPTMAIIGAGPIGLMTLQAAINMRNARVLVADIKESRLDIAREIGAEITVNPNSKDLVNMCLEFSGADGIDICIDAVGTTQTKQQSISVVRPGGSCCWVGLSNNGVNLNSYDVILSEKKIIGTYSALRSDFEYAMKLLCKGRAVGGSWVKVFPINEAVIAFEHMMTADGNNIKAVILPQE
jgi:L-iditol 2-dehydrogenase